MTQVRPTLLIVEDNELNRDILNEILKDEYKTYLAENGAEGLRLLRQHSAEIDLVLLDIEMPVMNGYDVLKAVRFDPELKDIPIIIITANDSVEEEVRCLKLGAKDFIRKPFNATVAKLRINSIVDMQKSAATLSMVELMPRPMSIPSVPSCIMPRSFCAATPTLRLPFPLPISRDSVACDRCSERKLWNMSRRRLQSCAT